eukprot:3169928-Pleurochrysis_carterae.AAC.1
MHTRTLRRPDACHDVRTHAPTLPRTARTARLSRAQVREATHKSLDGGDVGNAPELASFWLRKTKKAVLAVRTRWRATAADRAFAPDRARTPAHTRATREASLHASVHLRARAARCICSHTCAHTTRSRAGWTSRTPPARASAHSFCAQRSDRFTQNVLSDAYAHAVCDINRTACERRTGEQFSFDYEYGGLPPSVQSHLCWPAAYSTRVLLTKKKDGDATFYRGMNVEVSMPTGTLCAERNAIGNALAADQTLKRNEIHAVAVSRPHARRRCVPSERARTVAKARETG